MTSSSPPWASNIVHLGSLALAKEDMELAEGYSTDAIDALESVYGTESRFLVPPLINLGTIAKGREDHEASLDLYLRSLSIAEVEYPPDHEWTLLLQYNLACLAAVQGDLETALEHLRQAIEGGWVHPWTARGEDLSALRGDPIFEELLEQLRANQARGRVRESGQFLGR